MVVFALRVLGLGVPQSASGVYNTSGMEWLMDVDGNPTKIAMILSLVIVMIASKLSALSSVDKGIKWLSKINMGLSFFMPAFFLMFGSTMFALSSLFVGL